MAKVPNIYQGKEPISLELVKAKKAAADAAKKAEEAVDGYTASHFKFQPAPEKVTSDVLHQYTKFDDVSALAEINEKAATKAYSDIPPAPFN